MRNCNSWYVTFLRIIFICLWIYILEATLVFVYYAITWANNLPFP